RAEADAAEEGCTDRVCADASPARVEETRAGAANLRVAGNSRARMAGRGHRRISAEDRGVHETDGLHESLRTARVSDLSVGDGRGNVARVAWAADGGNRRRVRQLHRATAPRQRQLQQHADVR